ncbi:tetratricopeptide repeat protein [bacterium]|nr:tetratricopeptide repeat protein [bacterium]
MPANVNKRVKPTKVQIGATLAFIVLVIGVGIWLSGRRDENSRKEVNSAEVPIVPTNELAMTSQNTSTNTPTSEVVKGDAVTTNHVGTTVAPEENSQAHASAGLRAVRELIEQKKFDQAIEQLDASIEKNPKSAIEHMLRGHAYERQAKLGEALADFNRAEALTNGDSNSTEHISLGELWEWRGEVYLQQTNAAAAISDFTRAIGRYSETSTPLTNFTFGAEAGSTNEIANSETNRVVDLPYVMRGYAYLIAGEPTNALPDLDYWIKRHTNDPLGYFYRGQVQVALEEPDAALKDFSRTIELDKNYVGAWEFRGGVHYRQGDYVAALDDFQAALKLTDKSEYAARMGGLSAFKLGKVQLTVDLLSQSLKLNPDNAVVYEDRGSAYAQLEQWTNALADYTKAGEYKPHSGRLAFYRANFQLCLGKMDEGLFTAEEALSDPDLDLSQRYYLIILTSLGKAKDSAVEQRLKNEVLPAEPRWPGPIIRLLRGEMDYAGALEATHDDGQRDELHTYAGWQLINAGRVNDGRELLQRMVREGDRRLFEYHIARFLLDHNLPARNPTAVSE